MTELVFFVPGIPVPGGSKSAFVIHQKGCPAGKKKNKGPCLCHPHAVVTDAAGDRNKIWRHSIKTCALEALNGTGGVLMDGPLSLDLYFYLPRPKGHYGKNGYVLPSAPLWPDTRPDYIKLARPVEDTLTKIVWNDDAQIVTATCSKNYSGRHQASGVGIRIKQI